MTNPMPMIVPPLFWEWFNIWLIQFLKDLYHEIKMVGLRGGNNTNSPFSHTCANHGNTGQPTGIDLTLNIPTSLTMASPAGIHLNPNQINMQSMSTVSLQFIPPAPLVNPGSHNHHSHNRNHGHSSNHNLSHNHVNSLGLGGSHNLTSSLGSSSSHSHTNSQGLSGNQSHTNSLGFNAVHSNLGLIGSHSHTNSVRMGGSHSHSNSLDLNTNHSNSLGLGSNHSHTSTLGLSGSHSHSTNIGLGNKVTIGGSRNHSIASNIGLGGSHNHTTSLGVGGNHSHVNLSLGGTHNHTNNLTIGHNSSLGLGGTHSHTTSVGLGGTHNYSSNLSLSGNHGSTLGLSGSHSSNIGLSSSHSGNLSMGGSHVYSSNLGVGGSHSHNDNLGLSGSHNNLGTNGSLNHSSNLNLGGNHSHTSNHGLSLGGNQSHSSNLGHSSSHNHANNLGLGGSHTLNSAIGGSLSRNGNLSLIGNVNQNNGHSLSGSHNLNLNQIGSQALNTAQSLNGSQQNLSIATSQNNTNKTETSRYSSSSSVLSSQALQYQLLKQSCRPVECYHSGGATAATYMPNSTGGTQSSSQTSLRVQPTPPQPSAPPAPQQDLSKTTMANHNFVSQSQTQPRPQYNFQPYRPTQHGTRPTAHPRQQQPFIPGAASSTGPVMYPTLLFQPHMGVQTYQQPRSGSPGYYQYHMGHYIGYNNPQGHTTPYYGYATNSPQLPTPSLSSGSARPASALGPQGSPAAPATPPASLSHQQPSLHHQTMPAVRAASVPKRSHRLPIIHPVTRQDILSNTTNNDLSGEQNDRQTPEPPTHSIAEEFTRMVNEAVNQPSLENAIKNNFVPKNVEIPVSSRSTAQPQNAISSLSSINNNIIKSDLVILNDNRCLGVDVAAAPCETPVVSAISDSPVIVPKMTLNVKPTQKIETTVQSIVIDTSKNTQIKQNNIALPTEKVDKEKDISNEEVVSAVVETGEPVVTEADAPLAAPTTPTAPLAPPAPVAPASQPQRAPRERHQKSEEKEKHKIVKEIIIAPSKQNGPTTSISISSVDSFQQAINPLTSQTILNQGANTKRQAISKQIVPTELATPAPEQTLTATELLSAGIEKVAREHSLTTEQVPEKKSSAFEAQAKLTQSISSVCRAQQSETKMKDINHSKTTDPDTANGNATEVTKTDSVKEDINKNEKSVKNTKNNSKKAAKMANNEAIVKDVETCENGKDETDKVVNEEQEVTPTQDEAEVTVPEDKLDDKPDEAATPSAPAVFVPKYKYTDDQWSPLNKSGKKCYDIGLLKQIKEDPLSKNKPNAPLLEACNVIRTAPMQEPMTFTPISRPLNEPVFPNFMKGSVGGSRNAAPRDAKKDGRNIAVTGKGSVKLNSSNNNSSHKPVIHVSLSLREDVKLNQVDSAWKPARFRKENLAEDEVKTQELYKQFRGILNKLTPQKFDTLLAKVKSLDINNQKRMEGVIDLLFEKAIEEPNFSQAYANMCWKLSSLKVPSDSNPEQHVNFRGLIISKCQTQFETGKSDEQVNKMEKELAETTEPNKKKELQLMINEENRKIRLRAVANVRFIGELYKLKMLTYKIMDYCMKNLIDKLEEEKLECLCKLLTTIGQQFEGEGPAQLDTTIKKMQEIVDRKSNKINSRVKFMIQDVIDLRRRKWIIKSVVDSQPKMMDQIQKEAEQQQRHIELINAGNMGGGGGGGGAGGSSRRDDGGRGKRGGDNRRPNFMDNYTTRSRPTIDASKFKAAAAPKSLVDVRLAPPQWNLGASGGKPQQVQAAPNIISHNQYSVLGNIQGEPTSLRGNRDTSSTYHSKGASIERSTFNSRGDFPSGGGRSGSVGIARPTSQSPAPAAPEASAPASVVPQEPLCGAKMKNQVKSTIEMSLMNSDDDELVAEVKHLFAPQYHAGVIGEIVNLALEKNVKEVSMIAKSLFHLVATNTIAPEYFTEGIKETLEFGPELFIDIPMLYNNLGKILAPHIEKKHITLEKIFDLSESVILANQGHILLKAIIHNLNESMGPTFVKSKWQESGMQLSQWMLEEQVKKWIADNKFEFLEGGSQACDESAKILTPAETQSRLLQLMNSDENCDCVKGWVQDKLGKASNEDWFMRALIQAICEHALSGNENRDVAHFNQDRMGKYAGLIHDFGVSKQFREANCLFGIQHLIHRLEHPQGLTLEIFQYLHEQYLISLEGFLAWEQCEKEPEGKGVMLKALTSFFTNIKEADNEDSGSED